MSEHRGRGTKRGDDWMSRVPRANVCPCCRGYWRLDGDCRKSRGQLPHSIGWTQTQRQGSFVNDAGWRDEQIVRLVPPRPQDTPVLMDRHERPLPDFGCCRQYTWRQYRTQEGVAGASTGTGEGRLSTEDMEWTAQRSGGWRGRAEVWVVRSQGSGIAMAWSTPPCPLRQGASLSVGGGLRLRRGRWSALGDPPGWRAAFY